MKKYSALVHEKNNKKQPVFIENYEYPTKKEFIEDLRRNGYAVDVNKVKETNLFNYIVKYTNGEAWDWKIKKIPQNQ